MSFTLNRNIGHRGELRLSRRLSLPHPRTCPPCLAQVATPTLLRGPPQLAASFIPLPRQPPQPPPRPSRGKVNQSPPAAQRSHAAPPNLPKSVTRFSPCQRARQPTTVASTRLPVSTLCQMPSLHRHRNGMTYVPT